MNEGAVVGASLLFVLLAASRRSSGTALGILILSMLVWPEFMRVPVGIVQMSVPRFVGIVLLLKFISAGRHRMINFGRADAYAIALWIWTIFATIVAGAVLPQVTQMIGRGLDTLLMYFVARMALVRREDAHGLFAALGVAAVAMCAAGIYEAVTWSSPYHRFSNGQLRAAGYSEIRHGMLRAQGSTLNSIYFGMAMMLVTGLIWSTRGYVMKKLSFLLALLAAVIAALTSLSSGPWIAMFAMFAINIFFYRPTLIKPAIRLLLLAIILVELVSNRHFYNLIDHLALDSQTAWYRTRLLEIAVSQWRDYWIFGVGSDWPHHWARLLDGRQHIDVVNNFVIIALYGGIPALLMYVSIHVIAVRRSVAAFQSSKNIPRKKLVFGLAATLLALDFSSMSVGLFGPALALSFILVGTLISVATAWKKSEEAELPRDQLGASIVHGHGALAKRAYTP